MGMTPLEGVIMGTRSGSIDPAVIAHLIDHLGMTIKEVMQVLTQESGLKGLCGYNDIRDIHRAVAKGMKSQTGTGYAYLQLPQYIGAYFAVLGGGLPGFTAGIGRTMPSSVKSLP